MSKVTVTIGTQWGDEGKGKWIDHLSAEIDIIARYQGGNNAGHTIYVNDQKIVLHLLPSGIFHPGKKAMLGPGVVIDPVNLLKEIATASPHASITPENLWIAARAHVVTPWHIAVDQRQEDLSQDRVGTTRRGIGPTYADKAARTGLRMEHFIDDKKRAAWREQRMQEDAFASFWQQDGEVWEHFDNAANELRPYVCDAEARLRAAVSDGQRVLLEGAQGALLDVDHGTYPYVTSSNTCAAAACIHSGLPPQSIDRAIGIGKAYVTRVGKGPFPTELEDAAGSWLAEKGNEFGATTGRPRRCGWFDGVAMRFACELNGLDALIINKIDVLSGLEQVKIAIAYQHPTLGRLEQMPSDSEVLADCQPIYETLAGWNEPCPGHGSLADLPANAQRYLERIEEVIKTPIAWVGTGPKRDQMVVGQQSW